ncbi:CHAT domain-containing protein [Geopyxis carbonaria]|nr:CHAT domain-containing protein [Geopyxis carbonaria]
MTTLPHNDITAPSKLCRPRRMRAPNNPLPADVTQHIFSYRSYTPHATHPAELRHAACKPPIIALALPLPSTPPLLPTPLPPTATCTPPTSSHSTRAPVNNAQKRLLDTAPTAPLPPLLPQHNPTMLDPSCPALFDLELPALHSTEPAAPPSPTSAPPALTLAPVRIFPSAVTSAIAAANDAAPGSDDAPLDLQVAAANTALPSDAAADAISGAELQAAASTTDNTPIASSISQLSTVIAALPEQNPRRALLQSSLATQYFLAGDLSKALGAQTAALQLAPENSTIAANTTVIAVAAAGEDDRAVQTLVAASALKLREKIAVLAELYKAAERKATADTAVETLLKPLDALMRVRADTVDAPQDLADLAQYRRWRFRLTRAAADITGAISALEDGLAMDDTPSRQRRKLQQELVVCLRLRFDRCGTAEDLDRAVDTAADVLAQKPEESVALLRRVLAAVLIARYEYAGDAADIAAAIKACTDALAEDPLPEPSEVARIQSRLAAAHMHNYTRRSRGADLDAALVAVTAAAAGAASAEHLAFYAHVLLAQYRRTQDPAHLTAAVARSQDAVRAISSAWDGGRIAALNISAVAHATRFRRGGRSDRALLERSLIYGTEVAELVPDEDVRRAGYLANLSQYLAWAFKADGGHRHEHFLANSILYASRAVAATGPKHASYATYLAALADRLRTQYAFDPTPERYVRTLECVRSALNAAGAPLAVRADAALRTAPWLAELEKWNDAYGVVMRGLEVLNGLSAADLTDKDRREILPRYAGLASLGAACAVSGGVADGAEAGSERAKRAVREAVQILQMGRGMVFNLQLRGRGDMSDLRDKDPELYDKVQAQQAKISASSHDAVTALDGAAQRSDAVEFERLVAEVRKLPGMANFLYPPTEDDLKAAAGKNTIVIINVAFRSDAFLITKDEIRALPLSTAEVTMETVKARAHSFRTRPLERIATLEWLWTHIAAPILTELGHTTKPPGEDWPRVHWIPTGALTHLPLHAAGFHYDGGTATCLDRVVSSYATSAKSLLYTRRNLQNRPARTATTKPRAAILASMPQTPGHPDLPGVTAEIAALKKIVRNVVHRELPTHQQMLADLSATPGPRLLHYAGHATPSSFLLADKPLTVADLTRLALYHDPPSLAYLSACSTGESADGLEDEGLHLVGAALLAGFANVVGALWRVQDGVSVGVAQAVYSQWGRAGHGVGYALHWAVREARETAREAARKWRGGRRPEVRLVGLRGAAVGGQGGGEAVDDPVDELHWAAYIHMGV